METIILRLVLAVGIALIKGLAQIVVVFAIAALKHWLGL